MSILLHGLTASPSLGTEITSVIFHSHTNVLNLKELFLRDVVILDYNPSNFSLA